MGNAAPTAEDSDEFAQFDGIETLGYRVLGVQPSSPASKAGLVSFFDFLVGANGQMLLGSGDNLQEGEEYDDIDFPALLHSNKGKVVELLVWNIKAQEKRFVELIPNDDWGGAGLMGVTIKLDDYGGADERLIRVLEVEPESPASVAGLIPMKDYLLGTTTTAFASTKILSNVLLDHEDRVAEIYVYNADSDMVRVVTLEPTLTWGGGGLLGAEVGTGYLHRLPNACRSTIGQSVERKVRWTNKSKSDEGEGGEPSGESVLEMEPHLEMEVEKDEDNRHVNPEEVTKQPHQLGQSVEPVQAPAAEEVVLPQASAEATASQEEPSVKAPTPPNTEEVPAQTEDPPTATESEPPVDTTAAESEPPVNTTAEATAEPPQPSSIPPMPPPAFSSTTNEAAASLFDGPPPVNQTDALSSPAPANTNFGGLPPPPNMTY